MFLKLFPPKRHSNNCVDSDRLLTNDASKKNGSQKLDKSKIRLVILADSDRGRTPFFDSDAITVVDDSEKCNNLKKKSFLLRSSPKPVQSKTQAPHSKKEPSATSREGGQKYRFHKLGSDVKVLEEMMFGTAPMAYKGSSLKVHVLRSPHKLMVTKVFFPEKPKGESLSDTEPDSLSLVNSMMDFSSGESFSIRKYKEASHKSRPVDVPSADLSDYGTDDDFGFASLTSSGSFPSSFPSPSNNSLSSYSSLHKRWMRSQTTSFNSQHRRAVLESSLSAEGGTKRSRRHKLAIAILFGSHDEKDEAAVNLFQSFVFSHFTLIEGHVQKLRAVIEKAYFNLKTFLHKTVEALDEFREDIYNLYMARRLVEPVWLTMMSCSTYRTQLCDNFMKELNALVTHYDKKDYKFFVSTLLSAVLTQHLTWVATVTPAGGSPTSTYLEKHSAKWVDTLAKTHPYNPLWAQLGDLFGAIGPPLKISRVIVAGKKADLVKRFLYILSYFIRCSDINEHENPCSLRHILHNPPSEDVLSPTLSDKTIVNGSCSDDRSSLQSPVCSQITSCCSSGTCAFSTSQNGETIRMMHTGSLADTDIMGGEEMGSVSKEPSIVYSDSVLKDGGVHKDNCSRNNAVMTNNSSFNSRTTTKCVQLEKENTASGFDTPSADDDKHHSGKSNHQTRNCLNLNLTSVDSSKLSVVVDSIPVHSDSDNVMSQSMKGLTLASNSDSNPVEQSATLSFQSSLLEKSAVPSTAKCVSDSNSSTLGISEIHTFAPDSIPVCSLTPLPIPKSPTVENVQHVRRCAEPVLPEDELIPRSASFSEGKQKSMLSQQLEGDVGVKQFTSSSSKPTTAELRKLYQNGGTSSMFDEYFKSDSDTKPVSEEALNPPLTPSGSEVKSSLTRMLSIQDCKPANKCRPLTPEMSRRRHLSSTSSLDYDTYDPLTHGREVKLPNVFSDSMQLNVQSFDRNFGRSLLAGFSEKYMSDFVLLGTSDRDFKQKLLNDLQSSVQSSFLDERIEEAVCIIADTDTWTVELASSKIIRTSPSGCTTWSYSKLVADLIESVVGIYKLKMGSEFCLMHLEDRLQEIYFKSFMLAEYLQDPSKFSQQELTSMLGFENSDMSLLFAVAGTHTPSLLTGS